MRWVAEHFDGFTQRLFGYKVVCNDGVAELTAHWFKPDPGNDAFRQRFQIDDDCIKRILPSLREMEEQYESHWEDLETNELTIMIGDERIHRRVYGGYEMINRFPEGAMMATWVRCQRAAAIRRLCCMAQRRISSSFEVDV